MSTTIRVTVGCDEPGCVEQLVFAEHNSGGMNVSTALRSATRYYGWAATSVKTARCPQHRKVAVKFHPFQQQRPSGFMAKFCGFQLDSKGRECNQYEDAYIHRSQ